MLSAIITVFTVISFVKDSRYTKLLLYADIFPTKKTTKVIDITK